MSSRDIVDDTISVPVSSETMNALRDVMAVGNFPSANEAIAAAVRVWQGDNASENRLQSIRQRITASLQDPRPDLTITEVDDALDALMDEAMRVGGRATG
ncbi:hypothetical protein [Rhizobium sp. RU36D]|uniref:hypothetical protein n=1 Tax=Rhizobium sp. RU36D TaxID=1907415 RepID=UPI0009D82ECD|nr:hypothetical protein [Rhizobium sp. RU36D]SMC43012.1 antitoxin ParD1/3/4 [Rhizobium sp. RU36D]